MTINEVPCQFCLSPTFGWVLVFLPHDLVVQNYKRISEEQHVLGKQLR